MKTILVNYTGRASGGANYAIEMTKGLLENNIRVVAIVSSDVTNIESWHKLKNIDLYEMGTYTSKLSFLRQTINLLFFKRGEIKRHFSHMKIDAIYVPIETYWTRLINNIFPKVPVFFTLHDPTLHSGESMFNRIFAWITKKNVHEAKYVITLSKRFIPIISELYGVARDRIVYLPHGAFWNYRDIQDDKRPLSYSADKVNFLFFGRIERYKGIDVLLRAYKRIEEKYPDSVTLTIAGKGNLGEYQGQLENLKHANVLNYMIPDEQVAHLFNGEKIITVLPYLDATQSGVIPTAQMFKSLIIASDTGALRDQLDDGKAGIMVTPKNPDALYQAMESVVLGNADYFEKVSLGYNLVNELKWPKLAQKITELVG